MKKGLYCFQYPSCGGLCLLPFRILLLALLLARPVPTNPFDLPLPPTRWGDSDEKGQNESVPSAPLLPAAAPPLSAATNPFVQGARESVPGVQNDSLLYRDTLTFQPVSVARGTRDPAAVWSDIGLAALSDKDFEAAERLRIIRQSPEPKEPLDSVNSAFPVIRGRGQAPDQHVPFTWQVLSELRQLAANYRLGSLAVTKMLKFITSEELTPFD